VPFPPLEFAVVKFSSPASRVESSDIVKPSDAVVALMNVVLSGANIVSLDKYHVVSMLSMATPLGALMIW